MSEFQCPLCGKHVSIRYYDPTNFDDDIIILRKRGLGRGKGLEIVSRQSIFDGDYPELMDLISNRVAVLYDLLYEDVDEEFLSEDEDEYDDESIGDLEKELRLIE